MTGVDLSFGQDDDKVLLAIPVYDVDGNRLDITGATVLLHYRIDDDSAPAVEHSGDVIGSAPLTEASYLFPAAETGTPGLYKANFLITLAGATERLTYPPDRHLIVEILPAV